MQLIKTTQIAVIVFAALAAAPAASFGQPSAEATLNPANGALAIDDRRPPDSLRNHPIGAFLFGCENGVWNLGDQQVGADRIPRLVQELTAALGDQVRGQTLVVRKYGVYLNGRAWVEDQATADAGLVGALLAPTTPDPTRKDVTLAAKCPRERMSAGWFATSELTSNFSPIVVEIDISLAGHDYQARAVLSPEREMWGEFHRNSVTPAMTAYVNEAISRANRAAVDVVTGRSQSLPETSQPVPASSSH